MVRIVTPLILLGVFAVSLSRAAQPVNLSESDSEFTLNNGLVSARIAKRSGDLVSLNYRGIEVLDNSASRQAGYWSHNAAYGRRVTSVTIDPKKNGGERGEVSIKAISGGEPLGSGFGGTTCDVEIRYALGRGDSGVYTYSIFTHPTNYPATSIGEARFCAKLNDALFDWMIVDSNRNFEMITAYDWNHGTELNMKEVRRMNTGQYRGHAEHKYDYTANQFDVRAWGWTSTVKNVGVWFINPSVEYLSGGPTKFELCAHRDTTFTDSLVAPAPPTLLNYWRSSHYGGAMCNIAATDAWTKVIGPFLIYCDSADTRDALWQDALQKAHEQEQAWPFDWVAGVDYPHKKERGAATGQIVIHDSHAPGLIASNMLVGLTAADYVPPAPAPRRGGVGGVGGFRRFGFFGPRLVTWQNDAKHYEFWVRADAHGRFTIPKVRPGNYTLHVLADGVLGDLSVSNIAVTAGRTLKLGKLTWQPVRYGRQLWDIGVPNRNASEFFEGDNYFHWGWYLEYAKFFPNDVNYVIGKSDFHHDWFLEEVPHNEDSSNTNAIRRGRSTAWSITFNLPEAPRGKATLRLAICGVGARNLTVTVNDQDAGSITNLVYNATIDRDGIEGSWTEHDLTFDASLMKAGTNVMNLIIPAGSLTSGVMYDYLRLELDESAPPPATDAVNGLEGQEHG